MDVEATICAITGAHVVRQGPRLQSLWGGYGEVRRIFLSGGVAPVVVIKHVCPPSQAHPRKLRSYAVEHAWYQDWSAQCSVSCRVPRFYGGRRDGSESLFVLEDMDAAGFAERRARLSSIDRSACLGWLASFHARFLGSDPVGLWPTGTYWHLATRPDELRAMRNHALRRAAPLLDQQLRAARFQTLVHGDAKPANFCFSARGAVAAVDFQYVGQGCGIRDVAYLLEGWRSPPAEQVRAALAEYFSALRGALPPAVDADALEVEWRELYPVARQDFARFLDGWGA